MVNYNLNNKVALITGANNPLGIGAAIARAFAKEGVKTFLTYLRTTPEHAKKLIREYRVDYEEVKASSEPGMPFYYFLHTKDAQDVVDSIEKEGGIVKAREADLGNPDKIPILFDKVESNFGTVDILINNAAACKRNDSIDTITAEVIDKTYSVNVEATLLLIAEFVKRHKKNKKEWGRIINLSTGPSQCFVKQIAYGSSKAAIEAFTRSIAFEVGPFGITVNTVAPGATQTGYIPSKDEKELIPTIPLRRLGLPADIADAILFLVSEKADWITGQVLRVNGGRDLY